jgi:streptogramin lyase
LAGVLLPLAASLLAAALPGATAGPVCGGRGIPYPQAALAASPAGVWVACRNKGELQRLRPATGAVATTVPLSGFRPWALSTGYGSLWAIDREQPTLLRLDAVTGKVRGRISLPGLPVYVWAGGGSIWLGLESGSSVARVDPASGRVRLVDAGDGASGFASDGKNVWIVSHRDNALTRVDASGRPTRVATAIVPPETTAAERIAFAGGSLWITGRGLDLLRVDPKDGSVVSTTEIGPAGIEVLAKGSTLLVSAATPRGAQRGDPILGALHIVDAATAQVTASAAATGTAYANGLVLRGGVAWTVDTVNGRAEHLRIR